MEDSECNLRFIAGSGQDEGAASGASSAANDENPVWLKFFLFLGAVGPWSASGE
jgi:hypothetical protein